MKNKITLPIVSAMAVILMILLLFLTGSGGFLEARGQKPEKANKASAAGERSYTLEELKEDFEHVRSAVEKKHPMFFAAEEEVDRIFDRRYALLEEGMSELDFYRVLSPAVAALKCGHSNVLLSRGFEQQIKSEAALLPLEVTVLEQRLYVVDSRGSEQIPPGSEVL